MNASSMITSLAILFLSVPALADDGALGKALFQSKGCVACHSVDGSPLVGPSLKGVFGRTETVTEGVGGAEKKIVVDDAYLKESILNPNAKIVKDFPPAMVLPVPVSEAEAMQLIAYLRTLK